MINTQHHMHLLHTENENYYTFCVTFCDITNTAWSIKISLYHLLLKVRKAKIRNRYNQVPHLTQDTEKESDKNTRHHHIQESQEASSSLTGDHKVATNRHLVMAKTNKKKIMKKIHKRKIALERSVRTLLEGLN